MSEPHFEMPTPGELEQAKAEGRLAEVKVTPEPPNHEYRSKLVHHMESEAYFAEQVTTDGWRVISVQPSSGDYMLVIWERESKEK